MSLVNDMLRDLDARRRDAPARGAGTEKLVPAAERSGSERPGRRQWLITATVLLLAAAAGVAVALYLGVTRGGSGQTGQPVAPAPVQSGPAAGGNGDAAVDDDGQTAGQLDALAARLAELEAENRRMRQEETAPDSPSGTGSDGTGQVGGLEPPVEDIPSVSGGDRDSTGDGWEPRDWSAPAPDEESEVSPGTTVVSTDTAANGVSGSGESPPAPAAENTGAGTATRTPREPTFAERDRARVQEALAQWSNGQRTEALEALDQFTLENPQAHLSREMLGKLLLQRGETGIAMQVADIGLRIAPMHDGYRKLKARLLMTANRPGEALELLDDRPPSVEGDIEYHELLATTALASREYRTAQRSYESLLGTDDGEGRWWYGLATALEGQGQTGSAVRAYERAQRSSNLSSRLRQRSEERVTQLTAQ